MERRRAGGRGPLVGATTGSEAALREEPRPHQLLHENGIQSTYSLFNIYYIIYIY